MTWLLFRRWGRQYGSIDSLVNGWKNFRLFPEIHVARRATFISTCYIAEATLSLPKIRVFWRDLIGDSCPCQRIPSGRTNKIRFIYRCQPTIPCQFCQGSFLYIVTPSTLYCHMSLHSHSLYPSSLVNHGCGPALLIWSSIQVLLRWPNRSRIQPKSSDAGKLVSTKTKAEDWWPLDQFQGDQQTSRLILRRVRISYYCEERSLLTRSQTLWQFRLEAHEPTNEVEGQVDTLSSAFPANMRAIGSCWTVVLRDMSHRNGSYDWMDRQTTSTH